MAPTLIVLAAGLGSRFGGAKQIEPFGPGGETLLELNVFDAIATGVRAVVLVTRASLVSEVEALAARLPADVARRLVIQEDEPAARAAPARARPWGTAHAVLAAGPPNHSAIVVNADDLYGRTAIAAVGAALATGAPAALAAYRLDRTLSSNGGVSRGVCEVAADGTLAGIDEVANLRRVGERIVGTDDSGQESTYPNDAPVSLNLWGLGREWWPRLEAGFQEFLCARAAANAEFRLPDVVSAGIATGARIQVVPTDATWVGVTHAEDRSPVRSAIQQLFSEGRYPSPLFDEAGQ